MRFETEAFDARGRRSIIDFSLSAIGTPGEVRYLVAEGQDVSAEREAQVRYRAVLDALHEGVVQQERGGAISSCNEAAERILGLTRNQMIGLSSLDPSWRAVHEDGSAYPGEAHPSMVALRTGDVQRDKVMGVHKPDGTLTWILINARPLRRPNEAAPYAVVSSFADITALKEAEARLRYTALHDALTGLPSRVLLRDRLEHAVLLLERYPDMCPALLFIDLDGFKTVNDTLGHEAGDELLVDVAQRLKLCVREGDTVARLGGDEFVILVENLEPPRNVLQFAERVLSELELPVAGTSIVVTASIGVVLPKAGMSARALLTQADKAMYRAKQAGRARYALAGD